MSMHSHQCSIYRSREQQFKTIVPILKKALTERFRCVYVYDENTPELIRSIFAQMNFSLDPYLVTGQMKFFSKDETYLSGGMFEPNKMMALIRTFEKQALDDGYVGLWGTGEDSWIVRDTQALQTYVQYESLLNNFSSTRKVVLLCQYDENKLTHAVLNNIVRTHKFIHLYGSLYENNYFYSDPQYFAPWTADLPADTYTTMINTILERQ